MPCARCEIVLAGILVRHPVVHLVTTCALAWRVGIVVEQPLCFKTPANAPSTTVRMQAYVYTVLTTLNRCSDKRQQQGNGPAQNYVQRCAVTYSIKGMVNPHPQLFASSFSFPVPLRFSSFPSEPELQPLQCVYQ